MAASLGSESNGLSADSNFQLHKAAFEGDVSLVKKLLEDMKLDPSSVDKHGNTALHIAVMLGHKAVIEELVKHGAPVSEKNRLGWSALQEAVSYGDRVTITLLLRTLRDQITDKIVNRRQELIRSLEALDDFQVKLKWEFHTWVPFLSRILPSDVCSIYKKGSCIRLDSTIGDYQGMNWTRGDKSFVFSGEDRIQSNTLTMVVLDNEKKVYQRVKLLGSEESRGDGIEDNQGDLKGHVNELMSRPIIYANMSTKPIEVSRAQAGWWFFSGPRSERVGTYDTDVHDVTNLILISRRRRENLTPEQIKAHERLQGKLETGRLEENDFDHENEADETEIPSLAPPDPNPLSWDQYIVPDTMPRLGRPMNLKIDRKHFKASVWMAKECPIEMKKLLDILEVIAPYKHFHKLRQFVDIKLPPGFPVKLEIPVFPTVTATVTMESYRAVTTEHAKFLIPRDYTKYKPKDTETTSS